jgi:exopolysaccharide biosynthesis polyprenyl glycosylphosphotransferase
VKKQAYKYILAILDFISIISAFIFALELRGRWNRTIIFPEFPFIGTDFTFLICFTTLVLFIFQYQDLYKINVFLTIADQIARLFISLTVSVVGFAVLAFFLKKNAVTESRLVLFNYSIFALGLLFIIRVVLFRGVFLLLVKIKLFSEPAIIIGSGKIARILATNISLDNRYALSLVGFVDDTVKRGTLVFQNKMVLGTQKEIKRLVQQNSIKEILVCSEDTSHHHLLKTLDLCLQTKARVNIASPLYDIISEKIFTEKYGNVSVVHAGYSEENLTRNILKRIFDVIVASIGFLIALPFLLIIAVVIRIDSPGPAVYSQIRIGKNGKPFKFYKFRSMVLGSDNDLQREDKAQKFIKATAKIRKTTSNTKIVDDSKITKVGRFLRKTSLDELPQLINVIIGDMSLVGPRPCLPYEWDHYDEWHKRRLSVTPGCTGVWQVNGRSEVSFEDMVVLDLYYIQNRSFLLDLKILLKTIPVMALGKGGI